MSNCSAKSKIGIINRAFEKILANDLMTYNVAILNGLYGYRQLRFISILSPSQLM